MIEEEPTSRHKPALEHPVLDSWGVAELSAYIAALSQEIARAEAEIARKSSHRSAAEAVFGRTS